MRKVFFYLVITLSVQNAWSQQSVGIGTSSPDPTAMLDISSNNKGLLLPRMAASQRIGISAPANGLLVYDTDSASVFVYQQSLWKRLKPISNLADLVTGSASNNVIAWNGSQWLAVPLSSLFTYLYSDRDGDGFGDKFNPLQTIGSFPGFIADSTDCNDNSALSYPGAADLPDDGFTDSNCDGIDGTESAAIFVSLTGNNANPGTKSQPVQTIATAITKATAQGKTQIYVSMGTYAAKVTLSNGISIYGGYNAAANWVRSASNATVIQFSTAISGRITAMEGSNITTPTIIDRLTIQTPNATGNGINNYAVYCVSCTGLTIKNSIVIAGNGSAGSGGSSGTNGSNGSSGINGTGGNCNLNVTASGGGGGSTFCSSSSGTGGNGGRGGYGNQNGFAGANGANSIAIGNGNAGAGGAAGIGSPGSAGTDGVDAQDGVNGPAGNGGSGGNFVGNLWATENGNLGSSGSIGGSGGGGGGGGGYYVNPIGDVGTGNGGGGGGSGGCPGTFGTGGNGGGASFGLLLVSSTGIVLTNNTITSGNGGNGGNGGTAGTGGTGGNGGTGAVVCTTIVGKGGDGGDGGNGGHGGGGGGGAGGATYAIAKYSTTVTTTGNTLNFGNPGSGGNGGTSAGNDGVAGTVGGSGTIFIIL